MLNKWIFYVTIASQPTTTIFGNSYWKNRPCDYNLSPTPAQIIADNVDSVLLGRRSFYGNWHGSFFHFDWGALSSLRFLYIFFRDFFLKGSEFLCAVCFASVWSFSRWLKKTLTICKIGSFDILLKFNSALLFILMQGFYTVIKYSFRCLFLPWITYFFWNLLATKFGIWVIQSSVVTKLIQNMLYI